MNQTASENDQRSEIMPRKTELPTSSLTLLQEISSKLDALEGIDTKLSQLLTALGNPIEPAATPDPSVSTIAAEANVIEVVGMEAPWVQGALKWDHKSEVYDEDELKSFLGFNPNGNDPDGMAWCAGFLKRILEDCGIDTTGLDLSAMSFANFGSECDPLNGAIMVFQPKVDSKYRISHVGIKVDDDKLFGGNQGDSCKRSNLAWYMANADLVACRCPEGYKLV